MEETPEVLGESGYCSTGGFDSCRNGPCTIHCLKANVIIICAYIVLLPLLLLLLCVAAVAASAVVMVCRMSKLFLWFIESDSRVFVLFIPTRTIFYVPLGSTVEFTASICLLYYMLGDYGHAQSEGARQPAASKPLMQVVFFLSLQLSAILKMLFR